MASNPRSSKATSSSDSESSSPRPSSLYEADPDGGSAFGAVAVPRRSRSRAIRRCWSKDMTLRCWFNCGWKSSGVASASPSDSNKSMPGMPLETMPAEMPRSASSRNVGGVGGSFGSGAIVQSVTIEWTRPKEVLGGGGASSMTFASPSDATAPSPSLPWSTSSPSDRKAQWPPETALRTLQGPFSDSTFSDKRGCLRGGLWLEEMSRSCEAIALTKSAEVSRGIKSSMRSQMIIARIGLKFTMTTCCRTTIAGLAQLWT
mmetsp:Transcript_16563/g.55952  ORF Transcript_16563/g.55952 Transcript_16563/m.55952 type:complete len:260 (+) Transcript_16563:847-1626(+)